MPKSVKVHDETHRALMRIKAQGRKRSLDEVIREMVRSTTGEPVERLHRPEKEEKLTAFSAS